MKNKTKQTIKKERKTEMEIIELLTLSALGI